MAQYQVTCEGCGKEQTVNLYGKMDQRKWKLGVDSFDELPVPYGLCDDCKEAARKEQGAKNKAANEKAGLPELTGSEKQINWAEKIRKDKVEKTRETLQTFQEKLERKKEKGEPTERTQSRLNQLQNMLNFFQTETKAGKIIDNRDATKRDFPDEIQEEESKKEARERLRQRKAEKQ